MREIKPVYQMLSEDSLQQKCIEDKTKIENDYGVVWRCLEEQ